MSQPLPPTPSYASTSMDERPYNVLSIVAFVLALVGVPLIGIILGHIGLSQTKSRGERGRGFAIAALVLGYLWLIAQILILILIFVAGSIAVSSGVVTS